MKKVFIISAIGVIALIGVGYYFFNSTSTFTGPPDEIKVRLGWLHQAQFAGFYVAQEKGFYDDAHLSVELLEIDPEIEPVKEVNEGTVDFSVMEAHQFLEGIDNNADIQAIMAIYQINPHALAVRMDSGISGPEDFSGKTVGLSGGEAEGNALFRIFIDGFENINSITYKNLGFDTVDDFANNRADIIDVYRTDQPYLAEKQGIPLIVIALDEYGFSTYGDVIVANSNLIEDKPELVKRFIKATQKGLEYALSNQEEAVAITLPYTSGNYNDIDYQRHILSKSAPLIRGPQDHLGHMEFISWSVLHDSMLSAGILNKEIEIRDIYTNIFIR